MCLCSIRINPLKPSKKPSKVVTLTMPTKNDMAFYTDEMERERGEIVDSLKQELAQLTLMLESSGVYAEAIDPR